MGRPNKDTVVAPKKIMNIAEMIFGTSKEVRVEANRSERNMLSRFAKENPDKIEVRSVLIARRKTNGKPKSKKFKNRTVFQF